MLIFTLIVGFSTSVFAIESISNNSEISTEPINCVHSNDIKNFNNETLEDITIDNIDIPFPEDINILGNDRTIGSFSTVESGGIWVFNDPYGIVDGNLTTMNDFYLVENTSDAYAFLKLTADDPNLLAILYYMDEEGNLKCSI